MGIVLGSGYLGMYGIRACSIDDRIHFRFPRSTGVKSLVEWTVWSVRVDAGYNRIRVDNAMGWTF